MKTSRRICGFLVLFCLAGFLGGCVYGPPGTYYKVQDNRQPVGGGPFVLGPEDQNYVLLLDDNTPFAIYELPQTGNLLYNKGYDQVRRQREADFSIEVSVSGGLRENPELRAGNTLGGAMFGAATGALIGAAVGDPGTGAAIGAASGGALGLFSPAATNFVTVDLNVYSFSERVSAARSIAIDLSTVPPYEVRRVVDAEVARMLRPMPPR
jgi:hypothetical protein